ncbi:phage tail tape measure protein [Tissierella sp. P1]|uniref:phage tail tape measure protein n=1 Tax=Tissierella sp. P1 TaxID=1280483 RepID=UPI000BA10195|nr:phage tail tape measure protein [Tissierella sp. P1]OZV12345.1 phage tail tape measure protein [Tissierella sp. P1]
MNDDSFLKIIASLGLDYNPAIESIQEFQKRIQELNKDLDNQKNKAIENAKSIKMSQDAFWKQHFQDTNKFQPSDEIKKLSQHYKELEKSSIQAMKKAHTEALKLNKEYDKQVSSIKESTLEQMKAQAAFIHQRATTKGLNEEYSKQSGTLREQLSVIQARLQAEGKLSAEEVKQTQQLKEQLDILKAQTNSAIYDKQIENFNTPSKDLQNHTSWLADAAMYYTIKKAGEEVLTTIKDVEMGMVEISRVMDDSSFVFKDYRDELFKLAVNYGQTFENVQSIALRWSQSGYNVADSLELTKTSLLALNTAELNATQATESMIGIMAQWQLQAEDMALVMDKINLVADSNSVTSQDLVDGLLRSSSAAKNMNMSIEETIGLLTVMREASGRAGSEIGNALNSIISFMQRPKSIDTLESMGIQMFSDTAKTQFRNIMDIFKDIASQWNSSGEVFQDGFVKAADDTELFSEELAIALGMQEKYNLAREEYNDLEKRDIAQSSAGVYRRNYFIGMIERLANVQGILNDMMDAEGYSMRENAKTMETLEKKTESLKASVEQLAISIGDAGLNNVLKLLVDGGTGVLNVINNLDDELKDFILSSLTTITTVKTFQTVMTRLGVEVPNISQTINLLKNKIYELGDALNGGTAGMIAFAQANPLIALSATVGVVVAITNAIKKQREEQERAIEVFNQQKEIYSDLKSLLSTYEELANKSSLATDEQEKLATAKQKIIDLLPQSKSVIENESMSLSEQVSIIEKLNEEELKRLELKAQSIISGGEYNYQKDLEELERQKDMLKELEVLAKELTLKSLKTPLGSFESKELERYTKAIEKAKETISTLTMNTDSFQEAKKILTAIYEGNTESLIDNSNKANKNNEILQASKEITDALAKSFEDVTSKIQRYNSFLAELNSKEGLSAKSKQEIISKHQELLPYLDDEKELHKQLTAIIRQEEKVQKQAYADILMINEEFFNAKVKGNKELVDKLGEFYNKDLENVKSLAHAKEIVESNLIKNLSGKWAEYYNVLTTSNDEMEKHLVKGRLAQDMVSGNIDAINTLSAAKKYKEIEERFRNIALDISSVDFKGINLANVRDSKDGKYENKQLQEALKLLEHRKKISEETQASIKTEIAELNRINFLYVKTADERMDMAERIYSAEKRLRDRTLQDSINWINQKKNLNELSVEDEIAAWERVRKNQSNNIEAVKQATLNLYKLRNQVMTDSFSREENSIKHLTKLGLLSVDEQIKKYRELYEVKASTLSEEQSRIENLFDLYKKQISDQQKTIKEAHDKRIEQIEEEAKKKKSIHEDEIKAIEKELELLSRQEDEYDHDKKMADLKEQLAYWQVRTSEDARKKVTELLKQIDEAEHKREVDLKKQSLEDKKKVLQDEVKSVEDTAREEREKLDKSYKQIEIAFDEHSINLIALASTMSKGMFEEFQKNYLIPLENALRDGDYNSIGSIVDGINDYGNSLSDYGDRYSQDKYSKHDWGMTDADYLRFQSNGEKWKELQRQGFSHSNNAEMQRLQAENDRLRIKYGRDPNLGEYPEFHTGAKTLSYGVAMFKPGELVFPPDLSTRLETLIDVLYQRPMSQSSSSLTDNRKEIKIDKLLNIERNYMEDDIDSEILVRQLQRSLTSL